MSYSAWHADTQRCPHLPLFNPDGYLPYLLPITPSLLKVAKVVFYYLLYLTNAKSPITCELITYDMLGLHLASLAVTLIDIASEEEKQSEDHLDSWLSRISIGKGVSPLRTLLTVHFLRTPRFLDFCPSQKWLKNWHFQKPFRRLQWWFSG